MRLGQERIPLKAEKAAALGPAHQGAPWGHDIVLTNEKNWEKKREKGKSREKRRKKGEKEEEKKKREKRETRKGENSRPKASNGQQYPCPAKLKFLNLLDLVFFVVAGQGL